MKLIQEYNELKIIQEDEFENYLKEKELVLGMNKFNGIIFENEKYSGKIRVQKEGDRIELKVGSKKVSRVMIDMKIPASIRRFYPLVVDHNDKVIYIPKSVKK